MERSFIYFVGLILLTGWVNGQDFRFRGMLMERELALRRAYPFGMPRILRPRDDAPRVRTSVGDVIGKQLAFPLDGVDQKVNVFLGIPYAEAPIGNLRFQKPVPKAPFTSPFNATDFGPACLQIQRKEISSYSEDCLSLNVYVPVTRAPTTLMPVMVWIHGGGFVGGVSSIYESQALSAFGDVIVVTLNYRLAQMGFLSINSSFIPGNYGLWDQHQAIQWVHDNIAAFGGDVNNTTIFGESAGSSSVMYQVLYPGNRGLFQRAIAESGGITSAWAQKDDSRAKENAQHFAKDLGCFTEGMDDDIMIACLRTLPENKIQQVMQGVSYGYTIDDFAWTVAYDGDFVPAIQKDMLKPSVFTDASLRFFNDLDLLIGINKADGMLYVPEWGGMLHQKDFQNLTVSRSQYENILVTPYLFVDNKFRDAPQVVRDLVLFTYTDWTNPDDEIARLHNLVNMTTDLEFTVPAVNALNARNMSKRSSYFYEFAFRPTHSVLPVITRITDDSMANHADELRFVFGLFVASNNGTAEERQMSKAMMTMWTNFAKTGNPNMPEDVRKYYPITWPTYDTTNQNYLELSHQMSPQSVKQKLNARRMALWTNVIPNIENNLNTCH